eukprot:TRINITY_DN1351_c0_g1_i1.p1 TRINITY_DN1351_c0_g1~~TRINITY_DN1351_c0_g1_i1.p1  ORF type:complete len:201 (+),score=32.20 TRINITY_DN1351_c0_g1_i1:163-765(+)
MSAPTFDPSKKKRKAGKKRAKKRDKKENTAGAAAVDENAGVPNGEVEYSYSQLLQRAYDQIEEQRKSKPSQKAIKVPTPLVSRAGRRTLFVNYPQVCKGLQRDAQHFMTYIAIELGTTCNLDVEGRLVILGSYRHGDLAKIVKSYAEAYVYCNTCRSRDTVLVKENRLFFVKCDSTLCGSKRAVPALKTGYVHTLRRPRG